MGDFEPTHDKVEGEIVIPIVREFIGTEPSKYPEVLKAYRGGLRAIREAEAAVQETYVIEMNKHEGD